MTKNNGCMRLALAALLLFGATASAADLPLGKISTPPASGPASTPAGNVFRAPDATCVEWSDGCRTCQRQQGGETSCSNIGIACQPKAISCQRR
jgi:hypothetical protein